MTDGELNAENILSVQPDFQELTKRAFLLEFDGKVLGPMVSKLKALDRSKNPEQWTKLMDMIDVCLKVEHLVHEDLYSRKALQDKLLEARLDRDKALYKMRNMQKEIRDLKKTVKDWIEHDGNVRNRTAI